MSRAGLKFFLTALPILNVLQGCTKRSLDESNDSAVYAALGSLSDEVTKNLRIGDGYDALTGKGMSTCLDSAETVIKSYPVNKASDTLYLVSSRLELANKLNVEANLEISGSTEIFTGSNSTKVAILKETQIDYQSYTAIAEYKYFKDEYLIYNSIPILSKDATDLLAKGNKLGFRQKCGDSFYKSVKTGASLYLIFQAQKTTDTYHDQKDVENTLKVALGSLFGLNASGKLSTDQKKTLGNFRISSRCYSEGTSAHPCADNMLNSPSLALDDTNQAVLDRIKSAKMALANDIDSKNNLVMVSSEINDYEVPAAIPGKKAGDVFWNYKSNLAKVKQWLELQDRAKKVCSGAENSASLCDSAESLLMDQMNLCALHRNIASNTCRSPESNEIAAVLSLNNAGIVTLHEDGGGRGRSQTLVFDDIYGATEDRFKLKANTLYNLMDSRFGNGQGFNDITSCFSAGQFKKGWKLTLFEHPDGSGSRSVIKGGTVYGDVISGFNDKASSFILERDPG